MKKHNEVKYIFLFSVLSLMLASCEDFLNRPTEDGYNVDNFYQTNEQCYQAVNPIYSSPWYDFQRGFIKIGDAMAGNLYSPGMYMNFSFSNTNEDLVNMSASLWSVNAYCNGVIENINMKSGPNVSEAVKNTVKGEALVWKAMAYFYLMRVFGEVPIVHNNSAEISAGDYNEKYKATIPNIYDYIILTLEKAIEWLPESNLDGRIDKYSAYGLLSKVYLTKSGYGMSGSRNADDLAKAAQYAKEVIEHSGRELLLEYSDIFRLANNNNRECLISWRWKSGRDPWTMQNTFQSDLAVSNFSEFADSWGGWVGPTVDLQDAFGENALSLTRNNSDKRRKATMMMYGDHYDYFWTDKGGFDWTAYIVFEREEVNGVGANVVKHLVGDNADHLAGNGESMYNMATGLNTHLLRLADVYLIYAEAVIGNNGSTTDASALAAYNKVLLRARPLETPQTSITWRDVWEQRRLELAFEGDRWYDYVRWHYYEPQKAIDELKAQKRDQYTGLQNFYENGTLNSNDTYYAKEPEIPNVTDASFTLPFPVTDLTMNRHLMETAVEVDVTQFTYE
ncbi:RagB/SusD family nutrient uptake outer membrane protein [termite gut metagenome]|uniref:RagB/SusD family nutrient uptake outer membrane protein n=1 Tax=termite gut metagenome TaxID=433724 RepID=A0A5J4S620_9ZZZZ